jgi:hypothetical protein
VANAFARSLSVFAPVSGPHGGAWGATGACCVDVSQSRGSGDTAAGKEEGRRKKEEGRRKKSSELASAILEGGGKAAEQSGDTALHDVDFAARVCIQLKGLASNRSASNTFFYAQRPFWKRSASKCHRAGGSRRNDD